MKQINLEKKNEKCWLLKIEWLKSRVKESNEIKKKHEKKTIRYKTTESRKINANAWQRKLYLYRQDA